MGSRNRRRKQSGIGLGLDFGTSTCKLAHFEDGELEVVQIDVGQEYLMPTVIHIGETGITCGTRALLSSDPGATYPSPQIGHLPIKLGLGNPEFAPLVVAGKTWAAEDMAREVLYGIAQEAEQLGYGRETCLTRPAYFSRAKEELIREAARQGTWRIKSMLAEPCAAGLHYLWQHPMTGNILIYDYGGGTFDCAVLRIEKGTMAVLSKLGNSEVGGETIRRQIFSKYFRDQVEAARGRRVEAETIVPGWSESAKIIRDLSQSDQAVVPVKVIESTGAGKQETFATFEVELSRVEFERDIARLVNATIETSSEALWRAGLHTGDLDIVVLVGGASRMPLVRRSVQSWAEGVRVFQPEDPDTAIAQGAALYSAGALDFEVTDVVARSLRLRIPKTPNTSVVLKHGSPLPTAEQPATFRLTRRTEGPCKVQLDLCEGEDTLFSANEAMPPLQITSANAVAAGSKLAIQLWCDNDGVWQGKAFVDNTHKDSLNLQWLPPGTVPSTGDGVELTQSPRLDLVVCLDCTASFGKEMRELARRALLALDQRLRIGGCEVRIGVVAFGDAWRDEPVEELPLSGLDGVLERRMDAALPQYAGADAEEDADAALRRGLQMLRGSVEEANKCLLLLTDADIRDSAQLPDIISRCNEVQARCYVVSPFYESYVAVAEQTQGLLKEPWQLPSVVDAIYSWNVRHKG